jgi:hypothetical protein
MPNRIKPRRSYTANAVPTTSDLETHELAINWTDNKAFTKNAAGNIVSVTLGGGNGGGSANIVEAATAAGFPATGASGTLYHATDVRRIYFWDSTNGVYVEAGPSGGSTDSALRALFVPPAPTSVTATAGNTQTALSWTAPTVLSQAPITDYTVQYSSNSGSSWTTFARSASTATSATVGSLTNGTAYTFRVAGVNAAGTGAYSTASSAVTPTAAIFRAIPILTSATSSGVASASAILSGGLDAWRAFDKATVTSDDTFYASPSPASGNWLQYDFGADVYSNIGGYSITPRYLASYGDSGTGVSQTPASWTLSCSNDGTNFTTVDTRNSPQSFSYGQARTFTLSSPVNYRVFRWTWTSSPAGGAVIVPKIQLVSA